MTAVARSSRTSAPSRPSPAPPASLPVPRASGAPPDAVFETAPTPVLARPSAAPATGTHTPLSSRLETPPSHRITTRDGFFAAGLVDVHVADWDPSFMTVASLGDQRSTRDAKLLVYKTDNRKHRLMPGTGDDADLVGSYQGVRLRTSGNLTNGTPKASYKIEGIDKKSKIVGMRTLNAKSMWNDVSQMREAIAFGLFAHAQVVSPRQVFGRLAFNDENKGLFSFIEQVDDAFLSDRFGKNDKGNLYKMYWYDDDVGPASLEHRLGAHGDDSGKQYYIESELDKRTYQLKTNTSDPTLASYDDLAAFTRVLNGATLSGRSAAPADGQPTSSAAPDFNSDAYRTALSEICDVEGFLRWAGTSVLLGAWDNYWATPANYYLYNGGQDGEEKNFIKKPYFHWIPWDYDNSLGIDYIQTKWSQARLLDPAATVPELLRQKVPLINNVLKNEVFKKYYIDHIEHMLDTVFNVPAIAARIGTEGGDGLWERQVRYAAYEEATGSKSQPSTGRQWTNDQLYWNGYRGVALDRGSSHIDGIQTFVAERHDSARTEIDAIRAGPAGALLGGAVAVAGAVADAVGAALGAAVGVAASVVAAVTAPPPEAAGTAAIAANEETDVDRGPDDRSVEEPTGAPTSVERTSIEAPHAAPTSVRAALWRAPVHRTGLAA